MEHFLTVIPESSEARLLESSHCHLTLDSRRGCAGLE